MSTTTGKTITGLRVASFAAIVLASVACTPINRYHGYTPSDDELAAVQVGAATRDSVLTSFGPPTAERSLQNDAFYYVSSRFRHVGAFAPEEVDRQVLVISFSDDVVSNIERFTLEDGRVVPLDRRVTEDGINDVTFLGQLLGSFGRVDAGALLGDEP